MLPLPDLAGLVSCPSCGRVTKVEVAQETSDLGEPAGSGTSTPAPSTDESASFGSGWVPPPVAAPPPGDSWAKPAPIAGAPAPPPMPRGGDGPSSGSSVARRLGCGCVPTVIILAVSLVLFGSMRSCVDDLKAPFQTEADKYSSVITLSGSATLVPGKEGATDVMAIVQDSTNGSTQRRLGRIAFSSGGSELLWQSDALDPDTYRAEVAIVGDTMFAGTEDQLYALDADSGKTRWRTTLQDKVTTGCPTCFAAVGDRLAVRTADAYVSAYGTGSGEPLWTRRLNSPAGTMSVVNDQLLISDAPEASGDPTPIALVDPANGKTKKTSTPTCPSTDTSPWALGPSPGDPVRAVPGSSDALIVFGFGDGCVVRWDPSTGTIKWTSRLTGASSIDEDLLVMGSSDVTFPTSSGVLITVDLATGEARLLASPADSQSQPEVIVGRTLIGSSTTTRGTPKASVVGWDLATGERLWSTPLPGRVQPVSRGPYHSSDALFDDAGRFLVVPTEAGANVFLFEGEQSTFTAIPVDVETGELGAQVRRAFLRRYESGTPSLTVEGVSDDRLVVSIDNLLQAIPVSGTGEISSFPPQN